MGAVPWCADVPDDEHLLTQYRLLEDQGYVAVPVRHWPDDGGGYESPGPRGVVYQDDLLVFKVFYSFDYDDGERAAAVAEPAPAAGPLASGILSAVEDVLCEALEHARVERLYMSWTYRDVRWRPGVPLRRWLVYDAGEARVVETVDPEWLAARVREKAAGLSRLAREVGEELRRLGEELGRRAAEPLPLELGEDESERVHRLRGLASRAVAELDSPADPGELDLE